MIQRPGSYQHGFAPRDFQPKYPHLWYGCVGAWCASLGPTGSLLRDWSGFGRHGTLTGLTLANAWTANQGQFANTFAGASGYISIGDADAYTPEIGGGFTAGGWINPTNAQVSMFGRDQSGQREWAMAYGSVGPKPVCFVVDNTAGGFIGRVASTALTVGYWSHWMFTYGGGSTSATIKIYVNGVQTDNANYQSGSFTQPRNTTCTLRIGSDGWGTWYTGSLDDCRIYKRVLSPNEIALLALRRGIAYEPLTRGRKVGAEPAAESSLPRRSKVISQALNFSTNW